SEWSAPAFEDTGSRHRAGEATPLPLLHPPQHLREGDVGKGAEEGVGFQLAAGLAGRGEAGQEAGEGSRKGQVRDLPAQGHRLAQARLVQVDRGRRVELRGLAAVFAPGAVAARVRELLSEARGEEVRLAA